MTSHGLPDLRVVIAHNMYASTQPSGENSAVRQDIDLIAAAGVPFRAYLPSSDDLSPGLLQKAGTAVGAVHNRTAVMALRQITDEFKPNILHVHNLFPLLSPALVSEAQDRGMAVVQTLHNYRLRCMSGVHVLHDKPCLACTRGNPLPGVMHGCYRGSRPQSAVMALGLLGHQRQSRAGVDRFICLTPFMVEWASQMRIAPSKIHLRPSSAPDPGPALPTGKGLLFVGRLDTLKGLRVLLRAWQAVDASVKTSGHKLMIAGSGPMEAEVAAVASCDPSIEFLGVLTPAQVAERYRQAAVVAVPSLWLEGFPKVIAEAFSHGRPVLVADNANLRTLVSPDMGWFAPPTASGLAPAIEHGLLNAREAGAKARSFYVSHMTPRASTESLVDCYRKALDDHG